MRVKQINLKLDEMRKQPIKTVEEQKKFINIKYPKTSKFKFSWNWLFKMILYILAFIVVYRVYSFVLSVLNVNITLFYAILILFLGPIFINLILKRFHLESDDIGVYFKW